MKKILKNTKGFTLVELVIVIAVIAILAAIAIPSYMNVIKRADDAKVISAARNAFSLAQVELLTEKIDTPTATPSDGAALESTVAPMVGVAESELSIETEGYTVKSATVTINSNSHTVTNGGVDVDD